MCLVPGGSRIREALRRQMQHGKVLRPMRGSYARAAYWRALSKPQQVIHILRTLQNLHPDWVFCHESAAVVLGLPVPFEKLDFVHVATTLANRNAAAGIVKWHIVDRNEPVIVQGLRVTSLQRTVFDCMRTADFKQALAVADASLRLSGNASNAFVSYFKRIGGTCTGAPRAVRTMRYADARSESGGESIARAVMIQQGFALPELQVALPQPLNPRRMYRVDFLWTRLDGS